MKHSMLGLAALACLSLAPGLSAAQSEGLDFRSAFDACAAISSSADRLACFDSLATAGKPKSAAAVAPEVDIAPATAQAEPERRFVIVDREEVEAIRREADEAKAEAKAAKNEATSARRALGTNREPYEARVVASVINNSGALFVELDNGEIWREVRPRKRDLPSKGVVVRMEPRLTGGWYMNIEEIDAKMSVRPFSLSRD